MEKLVQPPTAKIENVKITSLSFYDVSLDFDVLVQNPNPVTMQLDGFDYRFIIENKEILNGDEDRVLRIDGAASSHIKIPLTLKYQDIFQLIKQTKSLDTLSYTLSGHLKTGGLLAGVKIPFSKSGSLPNLRVPRISIKSLKIKKLDFSGVDMELLLGVNNPNAFNLDIGSFDYQINLANQKAASGHAERLANIPAKRSGDIRLPLTVNFFGVASSLSPALTGQSIQCNIKGKAAVRSPFGMVTLPFDVNDQIKIFR